MKRYILEAVFCLLAFGSLTACGKNDPDIPDNGKGYAPIILTKAEQQINSASNSFGLAVYNKLFQEDQMMVSPLSLSLALSMCSAGADGQTAKDMCATLGFADFTTEEMSAYYKKMVSALLEADPKTTFEVANSIWIGNRTTAKKGFIKHAEDYYSSEVYNVDFSQKSTVDAINKWCSDKTHGKIKSIMSKPDPDLMMALINALYFYGKWSFEFDKTAKENFKAINGNTVKTDMMHAREDLMYSESDGFRMVRLPYGNGSFSMEVILPGGNESLKSAVARLDDSVLNGLDSSVRKADVDLKLPKFTFEYQADLVDILKDLGMGLAFSNLADFSKMAEQSLKISQVKQKTFIDVNEKGTEAAAVTFIGMMATSAGPIEKPFVEFHADRPFLFLIREKSTGAILFMGQKVS